MVIFFIIFKKEKLKQTENEKRKTEFCVQFFPPQHHDEKSVKNTQIHTHNSLIIFLLRKDRHKYYAEKIH